MAVAFYPGQIVNFGADEADFTSTIYAAHPNDLRAEVVAIETILGINPNVATSPLPSGSWVPGATFSSVNTRLANIEQGIVGDSHTQYVKNTGGTVTGNITFSGGAKITGLPTPSASTDAVNKSYADSLSGVGKAVISDTFLLMGA